jgi:hypothetical protein
MDLSQGSLVKVETKKVQFESCHLNSLSFDFIHVMTAPAAIYIYIVHTLEELCMGQEPNFFYKN